MIYIGQRKAAPEKFLNSWYYGSGKYILLALEKYGKENFSKDVLEEYQDQGLLDRREKYWIGFYGSRYPGGYNIADGAWGGNSGGQNKGKHWSSETKKKISESLKRGYASGKILSPMKGKKHSEEARQKIKQKRKNQIITKEAVEKAAHTKMATIAARGYYHSEEAKRKISTKKRAFMLDYYAKEDEFRIDIFV